jgi:hypothetical protein
MGYTPRAFGGDMRFTPFFALFTLTVACTGDGGDTGKTPEGDADTDADTDADSDADFAPTDGDWAVVTGEITDNTCGDGLASRNPPSEPGAIYTFAYAGGGAFTITEQADGSMDTCLIADTTGGLSEYPFSCDPTTSENTDAQDMGFDALIITDSNTTGSFTSAAESSTVRNTDVSCEGSDCATVAGLLGGEFPCAVQTTYTFAL